MKQTVKRVLYRLCSNALAQRGLQSVATVSELLMGIGSAGDAASSGEESVLRRLRDRCTGKCVVIDVGANQGQFLGVTLRVFAGRPLEVHAFEPSQSTYNTLEQKYRSAPGVFLNRKALGATTGTARLYSDQPGSGLASMTQRRLDHFGLQQSLVEQIELGTLDEYCVARGLAEIALLKLDVEGHELDVLRGASAQLRRGAIKRVLFEFGGCNIDTRTYFQDFYYLFRELDMALYRLTPGGYLAPVRDYRELYEKFRTTMFVALRPDSAL